ncbi:helix-turn-helix domain-containing protein [Gymnodinialimonas sp. 57CJ19]|uniref:winged helix-turn-helix transcriptional regulator n=1 Tax=Gymnodinialimonas sp. 57CJ19 TaxID=3138498 RepID=UPI0031342E5E
METTLKSAQVTENALSCPSDALLRKLWGQWKTHVIYVLGTHHSCRFGVLKRTIAGISPKILTQRLRELEADGLVWREQENTIPPKVTYGLTEAGRAIHDVLKQFDPIADSLQGGNSAPRP